MSSSDLDLDAPTDSHYVSDKHRKQQQRNDALARLKRSTTTRSSTRPTPRFLGAAPSDDDGDDHDDQGTATQDVDFEQWERRDLERRRERRPAAGSRAPARAPARESDPALSRAFDDLFDLGDDGIRTGEPASAALDVDGTGAVDVDGLDAEGAPAKKRRVVAKMDEVRLLGPSGFPRLREDLKRVRIKGKGHEMHDLKRVLSTYQLWAHQMYPKTNFRDTLVTIEKLCHKRTVQRALKEYRDDEKHGRATVDEQRERDAFAGLDIPSTGLGGGSTGAARAPATLPESRALLAAAGFDEDEDEDFFGGGEEEDFLADEEALLAELEAEATATATAGASRAGGAGAGVGAGAGAAGPSRARVQLVEEEGFDDEVDEDAEAEAAMREAEAALMM